MSDFELLVETITNQIEKPAKAVVNSESSFVKQELFKQNPELAKEYWDWVCTWAWDPKRGTEKFGQVVYELQVKLEQISKKSQSQMPAWGTYGT